MKYVPFIILVATLPSVAAEPQSEINTIVLNCAYEELDQDVRYFKHPSVNWFVAKIEISTERLASGDFVVIPTMVDGALEEVCATQQGDIQAYDPARRVLGGYGEQRLYLPCWGSGLYTSDRTEPYDGDLLSLSQGDYYATLTIDRYTLRFEQQIGSIGSFENSVLHHGSCEIINEPSF